jgi:hypothetical protein
MQLLPSVASSPTSNLTAPRPISHRMPVKNCKYPPVVLQKCSLQPSNPNDMSFVFPANHLYPEPRIYPNQQEMQSMHLPYIICATHASANGQCRSRKPQWPNRKLGQQRIRDEPWIEKPHEPYKYKPGDRLDGRYNKVIWAPRVSTMPIG